MLLRGGREKGEKEGEKGALDRVPGLAVGRVVALRIDDSSPSGRGERT